MAYVDPTQDQEDTQSAQGQVVTGGAPQAGGGTAQNESAPSQSGEPASLPGSGGGVLSPGSAASTSPATGQGPAKPSASGSWTNLQSYLDSNTDQAAQMGNQIAGSITNTAKGAQDAIGQAKSAFDQGVSSSGADLGQEQGFIDQAIGNAVGTTADTAATSRFTKDYSGAYTGPKSLADVGDPYKTAQTQIAGATQKLGLTGSEAGRMTLLQDQYGQNQQYNQGEQNLDQLLLEGNPNAQSALQNASTQWSGLSSALSGADTAAQQAAAARAASTQAVNQYAQKAISGAQSGIQSAVNQQVTQNQQEVAKLQADLDAGNVTPEALAKLGLSSPLLYTSDPRMLLAQYVKAPTAINAANTATAEQQAQYAALAKLSGQDNTFLPYAEQAGSYSGPYDTAGLAKAVAANKAGYDSAAQNALAQYNQAMNSYASNIVVGPDGQLFAPNGGYTYGAGVPNPSLLPQLDLATFEKDIESGSLPISQVIQDNFARNFATDAQKGFAPTPDEMGSQPQGALYLNNGRYGGVPFVDTVSLANEINNLISSFGLSSPLYGTVGRGGIGAPHTAPKR